MPFPWSSPGTCTDGALCRAESGGAARYRSHPRPSPGPARGPALAARYAVGGLQGCLAPPATLPDRVGFDPRHDQLWCVGDLDNRGPHSLEVLRRLRDLGPAVRVVLGNHDLHLLAEIGRAHV